MDEKIYKITLSDGTELNGLRLNGNNFISDIVVQASIFESNCSPVIINNGDTDFHHENMELVQITEMTGKYWFILRDISFEELAKIKMQADIEYVAMMAGVEL